MKPNPYKILKMSGKIFPYIVIAVLLFLLLTSCGSMKKNKQYEIKEETKIEQVSTSESSETEKVEVKETEKQTDSNTVITESEEQISIKPVNPDKPMVVDGREYLNAEINKSKTNKQTNASENSSEKSSEITIENNKTESEVNQASVEVYTQETTNQSKERKSSIWIDLWWLWAMLVVIAIYLFWRKVK